MEKIIVNPLEVRGLGNVVSPKTLEDFEVYDAELSFEDSVYTLVYDASAVSVGLSVSSGSISVGESVVLTAEVLSGGEPASGETVSFYDGSTLLGTDETDSEGLATYTASSLTVGSHSLTASALDKSSSAVTVTVNKLTSTITLSVPASGTVGTSYLITGTLVPTTGSVKLYENNVLKDTLTVSSGSFSKAITQSNEGTYSYYVVFEGSSTYSSVTSSTGSIVVSDVPTPTFDSIELTGSKSILSYADSDSCVLSAQLYDGDDLAYISGVSVEFFKGSTSLGTASTNAQGLAEKTYASAGSGDVSFTASVGTIVSETYEIQDCKYYNDGSSVNGLDIGSNVSCTSNGEYITITTSTSGEKYVKLPNTLTNSDNWEYSVEIAKIGTVQSLAVNYVNGDGWAGHGEINHNWFLDSNNVLTQQSKVGDVLTLTKQGSNVSVKVNGTQIATTTKTFPSTYWIGFYTNNNRTQYVKNIKLKPL